MNQLVKDGEGKTTEYTVREHLQQAAKANPSIAAKLEGPPFPEELRYLYRWAAQLTGRSGIGFGAVAPLSYSELDAFCRLTGARPNRLDVEGLMLLDAVMRHPEVKEEHA
jgi:hypothetical protein